jgi:hypothetical protein
MAADRTREQIAQRGPEEAVRELHAAIIAINATMAALAKMFPDTTAIAGIDRGQPCGALAFARSAEFHHFTPGAMDRAKGLASIVASLPHELRNVFEIEARTAREISKLLAEEKARAAALAAADETRSE